MIYSNLAGTTSNTFKVGSNSNGQILSNNAYDFFWNTPDPISGAQNLNIRTLGPGNNIFDLKDVGQYCCTSDEAANQILNMPKQTGNLAFLLLVEPSIGYNTRYIKYTMRFRNGEMWTCERVDNSTFIAWERYAWANEIQKLSTTSGTWTPTLIGAGFSITQNSLCNYSRYGNVVIVTGYMKINRSSATGSFSISGLPFNMESYICGDASISCNTDITSVSEPCNIFVTKSDVTQFDIVLQMWAGNTRPQTRLLYTVLPQNSTISLTVTFAYLCR